jgi:hypothetical protein
MPPMPPAMVEQMKGNLKRGKPDQFGVTGLNVFAGKGEGWCLTDAPNADAVCKSHDPMGIKLEHARVTEVQVLN